MSLARLFIPLLLVSGMLHAEEKPPSEQLYDLMQAQESSIRASRAAFQTTLNQFKARGVPDEGIAEMKKVSDDYFEKMYSNPELKKRHIALFDKNFSSDELNELIRLYQTPLGKKLLVVMPELGDEAERISAEFTKGQPDTEVFRKQIGDIYRKYQRPKLEDRPDEKK